MENQKTNRDLMEVELKLNKLLSSPTLHNLTQFFKSPPPNLHCQMTNHDVCFLTKVQKDIMTTKQNILKQLYNSYSQLKPCQVMEVSQKLRVLIQSSDMILGDGIINLFSQIIKLRDACPHNSKYFSLLSKITQTLEPLFRDHYIFKAIQKKQSPFTNKSFKIILSQKKINNSIQSLTSIKSSHSIHSIKQFLSDTLFNSIKKNIENKSIQELIEKELEDQKIQICEAMETCRICLEEFKLKNLEMHVEYCSKIKGFTSYREQILQKQIDIIQLIHGMIQNGACQKIYKNIVSQFEEMPTIRRRNSLHGQKKSKKASFYTLEQQLDDYLSSHDDQLLKSYRQLLKQRENIEKKMLFLEKDMKQNRKQRDSTSSGEIILSVHNRRSSRNAKTSKLMSYKTKKSLFAKMDQNSQSNESKTSKTNKTNKTNKTKTNKTNKTNKTKTNKTKTTKNKSMKVHMNQILDSDIESQELLTEDQRLYRSLTNFTMFEDNGDGGIGISADGIIFIIAVDFDVIKFLGKGAFGKVYMARRKTTRDIYALKVIKLQQNWNQKQLNLIKNQHQILSKIAGEHLVKAPFSFTQGQAHFFVLQYMPGGDLAKLIEDQVYLDLQQSQFYLAQIVLAIQKIHEIGIIHRDLKPENLIFDEQGHLKLTDFGLSQIRINDKLRRARKHSQLNSPLPPTLTTSQPKSTSSPSSTQSHPDIYPQQTVHKSALTVHKNPKVKIIGTPDYIAPQIIKNQSLDNLSIDWWSLGVIAYQMMIGCRPFCADTVDQVINNIQEFKIQWPKVGDGEDMICQVAYQFIKGLLNPNYQERLGSKSISEIKQHPFFANIDWSNIHSQPPPLLPQIDPKQNYEYFEQVPELRAQIKAAIGDFQAKSSLKLQNFVRYDILVQETISSIDKQILKRQDKIQKLKNICHGFADNQLISQRPGQKQPKQKCLVGNYFGSDVEQSRQIQNVDKVEKFDRVRQDLLK